MKERHRTSEPSSLEAVESARGGKKCRERGAALLMVLWIFIVLFAVVLDFATSMRDDGLATANFADETQAYYIALGGLNRAVYDVLIELEDNPDIFDQDLEDDEFDDEDDDEDEDEEDDEDEGEDELEESEYEDEVGETLSADGTWHEHSFGGGNYRVRLLDEGGKINLNKASEPLLMRIVRRAMVGGNATEGTTIKEEIEISSVVHSILDWRDSDDLERLNGAEARYYASLRRPYTIKNGRFDGVDELLLVKGVTPDLYYGTEETVGLRQVFSVFSRSERINVLRAPAAVLRVLLDVDEVEAEELVEQRETESFGFVPEMRSRVGIVDPELAELLHGALSGMVTVEAHGAFGPRGTARVAAIVDLTDSFEGARVFRWFDRVPAGWDLDLDDEDESDEDLDEGE